MSLIAHKVSHHICKNVGKFSSVVCSQVTEHPSTLRHIPPDLMYELLSSAHLYVMQTEFSIYVMLKVCSLHIIYFCLYSFSYIYIYII